jgi:hypothetical protein
MALDYNAPANKELVEAMDFLIKAHGKITNWLDTITEADYDEDDLAEMDEIKTACDEVHDKLEALRAEEKG